jgi:hypothetical protein
LLFAFSLLSCTSALDREAKEEATKYWNSLVTKCDNSFYIGDNTKKIHHLYDNDDYRLAELKGISTEIMSTPLSEADKLNGVEWKGTTHLRVKSARFVMSGDPPWTEWFDTDNKMEFFRNGLTREMRKQNGKWIFEGGWGVSVDCAGFVEIRRRSR